MSVKKAFLNYLIKFRRYILKEKFIAIFREPLKGYKWSTEYNYSYLTGDYEHPEAMKTFCSWFHPGSVFFDLGANVGYYSLIANRYIFTGKIFSFEPIPGNVKTFNEHLRLNAKRIPNNNIHVLPYALSNTEKEVYFSSDVPSEGNTYLEPADFKPGSREVKVQCFSIDGLLEKGYPAPEIMKIDVEGAEWDVLRGAEKTLLQFKPKILLATHDCHFQGVQKLCVDFLEQHGYELFRIPSFNKTMKGLEDYIAVPKGTVEK